jgi:hypothetical protein
MLEISHFGDLSPVYGRNQTCDLPNIVHLAQHIWVMTLIVPGIAPAICSAAIISHTTPSACSENREGFVAQVSDRSSSLYSQWQEEIRGLGWPKSGWESTPEFVNWFRNRCTLPNTLLWVFLALFLYAIVAFAVVLVYVWTTPAPE